MGLRQGGRAGLLGPPAAEGFDTMPAPLVRTFRPPAPGWAVAGRRGRRRWGARQAGVVLYSPQTLVPSLRGTTSLGSDGPPASWAWCFTPRKPLFLRRGAPRLWGRMGLRQVGCGASLPANPYSFVARHHAFGGGWADRRVGVVLRSPLTLVPSLRGTTSLGSDGLTARRFLKSDA